MADNTSNIVAKVLLHSGVKDDQATDIAILENEFEAAGATYEIVRYGSGVYHSFTEWSSNIPGMAMYDARADYRSWESTKLFLKELFTGLPASGRNDGANSPLNLSSPEYACVESENCTLRGYMARHPDHCSSSSKCPAVVIIHNWDGMNDYEMERARMVAELGYVAFAADIYSVDQPLENMMHWIAASSQHTGNATLYMARINAALDKVKTYEFVDTSKIAVIGYCFGGTGIVNMAILGSDVLGVVGYHSGIAPSSRGATASASSDIKAKILLHSGVKDDEAAHVAALEDEFEAAGAKYEVARRLSSLGKHQALLQGALRRFASGGAGRRMRSYSRLCGVWSMVFKTSACACHAFAASACDSTFARVLGCMRHMFRTLQHVYAMQ